MFLLSEHTCTFVVALFRSLVHDVASSSFIDRHTDWVRHGILLNDSDLSLTSSIASTLPSSSLSVHPVASPMLMPLATLPTDLSSGCLASTFSLPMDSASTPLLQTPTDIPFAIVKEMLPSLQQRSDPSLSVFAQVATSNALHAHDTSNLSSSASAEQPATLECKMFHPESLKKQVVDAVHELDASKSKWQNVEKGSETPDQLIMAAEVLMHYHHEVRCLSHPFLYAQSVEQYFLVPFLSLISFKVEALFFIMRVID